MDINKAYTLWKENIKDPSQLARLNSLQGEPELLADCFYKELEFGTAGLRAELGMGPNRMNEHTVRRATLALGRVLGPGGFAAIAYDTRRMSHELAQVTAQALCGLGIDTYIFDSPTPLPLLSYAIRELGCMAGVMITASHNPPEYNGYKCFGDDGAQISGELAHIISQAMKAEGWFSAPDFSGTPGKVRAMEDWITDGYYSAIRATAIAPMGQSSLRVLYTPLHGAGAAYVPRALGSIGISSLELVEAQMTADPDFSTCPSPNPENESAFSLAYAQAQKSLPDIIIATDPDCDRTGLSVRCGNGYRLLDGNQVGCLLLDYILGKKQALGRLPKEAVAIKSFVSLPLAEDIAAYYGCRMISVPVGFKYLGGEMTRLEKMGLGDSFVFAFEESCGYLGGMHCRDKDGVWAAMLLCEMAASYKAEGLTLIDVLESLSRRHGYWLSKTVSVICKGAAGADARARIMAGLRENLPKTIGGMEVLSVTDYLCATRTELPSGETFPTDLPPLDVLQLDLKEGRVMLRPSGTEPKIKAYYMAHHNDEKAAGAILSALEEDFSKRMN